MSAFLSGLRDIPWAACVMFLLCFVVLLCIAVLLYDGWAQGSEKRAIRRKRRQRKIALRVLQGPSPDTERRWYRDLKGVSK